MLNADDCYGRDAIAAAARFLAATPPDAPDHAVVGYRLDQTASPAGGVNRAVLRVSPEGLLQGITETRDLVAGPGGEFGGIGPAGHVRVAKDAPVSMNLWAFTGAIFPLLEAAFLRFLEAGPGTSGESYLPDAVQEGLDRGQARVRVLPTTSRWCGVTYAADREWVQRQLAAAVDRGDYPAALWALSPGRLAALLRALPGPPRRAACPPGGRPHQRLLPRDRRGARWPRALPAPAPQSARLTPRRCPGHHQRGAVGGPPRGRGARGPRGWSGVARARAAPRG